MFVYNNLIRCFGEFGKIDVLKYTLLWLFNQQLLAMRFVLEHV